MDFRFAPVKAESVAAYVRLFADCFPAATHFTTEYLSWLYWRNPDGMVLGFDAWDGDRLAAHYVCIPARVRLFGRETQAMLSLNTATHPDFQGKGLFTKLAELTYQAGPAAGISAVFGVANANSTPGFIRKLGFKLVSPLDARVGVGGFGKYWSQPAERVEFQRLWTPQSLQWRIENPANPVNISRRENGVLACSARTSKAAIRAYGEIPDIGFSGAVAHDGAGPGGTGLLRAYIGLFPAAQFPANFYFEVPKRFRPSPLNFIYRALEPELACPEAGRVLFSFLDFDAF